MPEESHQYSLRKSVPFMAANKCLSRILYNKESILILVSLPVLKRLGGWTLQILYFGHSRRRVESAESFEYFEYL